MSVYLDTARRVMLTEIEGLRQLADGLTGNEVRAATCAALRSRPFPRADAPR